MPGLSPRVRGNLAGRASDRGLDGSIPASAGEPPVLIQSARGFWVYPRECGGTYAMPMLEARNGNAGLSPRVRGNLRTGRRSNRFVRSIPASAGEPSFLKFQRMVERVYPRECGGTLRGTASSSGQLHQAGLSPRVRGNRLGRPEQHLAAGLSRECGGTFFFGSVGYVVRGLSPRVRGNRKAGGWARLSLRSIPASASDPLSD